MRLKLGVSFMLILGATVPVVPVGSQPVSAAKLPPSERRCFAVSGDLGAAALVNLTPVLADGAGDGQLVASDVTNPPTASNVNFGPGTVDPNVAITPIGADGQVCFVNSVHTNVHLVADHLGTVASSAYAPATPSGAPERRVDTRKVHIQGTGCFVSGLWYDPCPANAVGAPVQPSGRLCFTVSGNPGDAALVNLTPVLASGAGDGQLVSSDVTNPPVASNVNFRPGSVDPNVAIAKIGSDGKVCFVNSVHSSVHLVADHLGTIAASAYTSASASGAPDRRVDTRLPSPGEGLTLLAANGPDFVRRTDITVDCSWAWEPRGLLNQMVRIVVNGLDPDPTPNNASIDGGTLYVLGALGFHQALPDAEGTARTGGNPVLTSKFTLEPADIALVSHWEGTLELYKVDVGDAAGIIGDPNGPYDYSKYAVDVDCRRVAG